MPTNNALTADIIAKALLTCVKNELVLGNLVNREYESEFQQKHNGYKVGSKVSVERPNRFYVNKGRSNTDVQAVDEGKASITVDKQANVRWGFNSAEMTLNIKAYAEKYLKDAAAALAQTVDNDIAGSYADFYNTVGTAGEVMSQFGHVSPMAVRLSEMAVPTNDRYLTLAPDTVSKIAGEQAKMFNSSMNQGAYKQAEIGRIHKLGTYETQNIAQHTVGATGGTVLVKGASQAKTWADVRDKEYQELTIDGLANGATLNRGDVFTIAGVYAVNPVPGEKDPITGVVAKKKMPYLQQFTVKEAVTADGSGNATVKIRPFIVVAGAQRTVSDAPADNAPITFFGTAGSTYEQELAFQKKAISLVSVPLIMPDGASWKARASHEGLSLRVTKEYDQAEDMETIRADILYGIAPLRPEFGVRHFGRTV